MKMHFNLNFAETIHQSHKQNPEKTIRVLNFIIVRSQFEESFNSKRRIVHQDLKPQNENLKSNFLDKLKELKNI